MLASRKGKKKVCKAALIAGFVIAGANVFMPGVNEWRIVRMVLLTAYMAIVYGIGLRRPELLWAKRTASKKTFGEYINDGALIACLFFGSGFFRLNYQGYGHFLILLQVCIAACAAVLFLPAFRKKKEASRWYAGATLAIYLWGMLLNINCMQEPA